MNDLSQTISWLHFGDLHITSDDRPNYRDFLALIDEANEHLAGSIDFAVLPGDNADDGTEDEYGLIRRAIDRLRIPLEIRPGDHDRKSGSLEAYQRILEPQLWRSRIVGPYRCLFLNSLDGPKKDRFDLGHGQQDWLSDQCQTARRDGQTLAFFMHAYPSEHGDSAGMLRALIARYRIAVVDMGHTHYNEIANDGHTIYAATRSTGQLEEGGVGFSITTIDRGVVSWKFNELGHWPLVKIVAPADEALIVDPTSPDQVVRDDVDIRARVWGTTAETVVLARIDEGEEAPMKRIADTNCFYVRWSSLTAADGRHRVTVRAEASGESGEDSVMVRCSESGAYDAPRRSTLDVDNAIGAYAAKGIVGTRLGPNANGRKW